jgi:hypothetical protein
LSEAERVPEKHPARAHRAKPESLQGAETTLESSLVGAPHELADLSLPDLSSPPGGSADAGAASPPALPPTDPVQGDSGQLHGEVHRLAASGTADAGGPLPHFDAIQAAFGRHDIGNIRAHTGPDAREAATTMGATAFATGHHVAFAGTPDLHTTAHEAAHVVQQRAGVALKGGVGQAGDAYEQHADEVADAVVSGRSAEGILDRSPTGGGTSEPVQLKRSVWADLRLKIAMTEEDWATFKTSIVGEQKTLLESEQQTEAAATELAQVQTTENTASSPSEGSTESSATASTQTESEATASSSNPEGPKSTESASSQTDQLSEEPVSEQAKPLDPVGTNTENPNDLRTHFSEVDAKYSEYRKKVPADATAEASADASATQAADKTKDLAKITVQIEQRQTLVAKWNAEIMALMTERAELRTTDWKEKMGDKLRAKMGKAPISMGDQKDSLTTQIMNKAINRKDAREEIAQLREQAAELQNWADLYEGKAAATTDTGQDNQNPSAATLENTFQQLLPLLSTSGGTTRFPFTDIRNHLWDFLKALTASPEHGTEAAACLKALELAFAKASKEKPAAAPNATPTAPPPDLDESIQGYLEDEELFGWSKPEDDPMGKLRAWALERFGQAFKELNI